MPNRKILDFASESVIFRIVLAVLLAESDFAFAKTMYKFDGVFLTLVE